MKKIILVLSILLVIVIAGTLVLRNRIAKLLLENGIENLVGVKVAADSIYIGLTKPVLVLEGIKIYNPAGFNDKYISELGNIDIEYNLKDIIKGFMNFPKIEINIEQVTVEKNKQEKINLDYLQKGRDEASREKPEKSGNFLIKELNLKIDKIRYIDNSISPTDKKVLELNYSKTFANLENPQIVVSSIISEITAKLIARGIAITVKSFVGDKDFIKAVEEGDKTKIKEKSIKKVKELEAKLKTDLFDKEK